MNTLAPLLLFCLFTLGLFGGMLTLAHFFHPRRMTPAKRQPFESGFPETATTPMPERSPAAFYVVGALFVLFDIETVFLYPWAVALGDLWWFGMWEILVFVGLVVVGYLYVWRLGGIEWNR